MALDSRNSLFGRQGYIRMLFCRKMKWLTMFDDSCWKGKSSSRHCGKTDLASKTGSKKKGTSELLHPADQKSTLSMLIPGMFCKIYGNWWQGGLSVRFSKTSSRTPMLPLYFSHYRAKLIASLFRRKSSSLSLSTLANSPELLSRNPQSLSFVWPRVSDPSE